MNPAPDKPDSFRRPGWLAAPARPRDGWLVGLLFALAAMLPVLVAPQPMTTDYGAHLARFHVMREIGHNAWLQARYTFTWKLTGNLGTDLLAIPLSALWGVETAGRVLSAIIPVLTGLGVLAVQRALGRGVGPGTLLAFAFVWSPSMLFGFLNFTLAFALALLVFALWIALDGRPWRAAVMVPAGLLVWLCHVSGWGILGLMVLGHEWSRRKHWRTLLAPWPLALPFAFLLFGAGTKGLFSYGENVLAYAIGIWMKAMRDQNLALDLGSLLAVIGLIALAALRRRIDPRLGWPALLLLLAAVIMPRHIFGGDYADYRMIPPALMLGCMAMDWPAPRWAMGVAGSLFVVRLAVTCQAWMAQAPGFEAKLALLDQVPRGAVVANAIAVDPAEWRFRADEHICGFAVVRRDALSNCNFAIPRVHMLGLKRFGPDFADPGHRLFVRRGQRPDLATFAPARHAEYLWYLGDAEPARLPAGATVIARAPGSLLARLAKPGAAH